MLDLNGIDNSGFRMYKNSYHNYIALHLDCNISLPSCLSLGFFFSFFSFFFERVEFSKTLSLSSHLKLAVIVDAQSVTDDA